MNKLSSIRGQLVSILGISALLVMGDMATPAPAAAQPGPGGVEDDGSWRGRRGRGRGRRFSRGRGCRGPMRADASQLKAQLGLSEAQVKIIKAAQDNFRTKQDAHRIELMKLRQQMRTQMQQDLPDETTVLQLSRKMRSLRGKISEEGIKARLKLLRALTKEQRTKLRSSSPRGSYRGQGRRGYRRGGGGPGGWGAGGWGAGGWGAGGWGPGGWVEPVGVDGGTP